MNKLISRFMIVFALMTTATQAQDFTPNEHQFELNAEVFPLHIRESYYTQRDNKLHGTMLGINGSWLMHLGRNFIKFNPKYAATKLENKGYQRVTTDKGSAFIFDGRGVFGRDVDLNNGATMAPYIGLGYHILRNNAGKDLTRNPTGWHFSGASQLYVPLGSDFKMPMADCYSLIANLEVDVLVNGSIRTQLPNCKTENSNSKGYGFRAHVGGAMDLASFTVEAKPFFQFWKVDGTKHTCLNCGYGADPKYTNRMIGLSVGVKL